MDDNLTLEYFLSLLDRAENVFQKDNLGEKSTDYEYSVEDIKREPELDYVDDLASCHKCNACLERSIFAEPLLNPEPKILFVSPMPEGAVIFSPSSNDYFYKWLTAINLGRKDIALTTLIKCPVKEFRKEYADVCRKHLKSEMERLKPRAMVLLGSPTAEYMLRRSSDFSLFRGRRFSINSIPVFCTYSPEDLVKDRSLRAPIWEDLQLISAFLKENEEK